MNYYKRHQAPWDMELYATGCRLVSLLLLL